MAKNSSGRVNIIDNFDPDGKPSVEFVKYSDMSNDELARLIVNGDSNAVAEYMKRKQDK